VGPNVINIAAELGAKKSADIDFNSISVSVDDLGERRLSLKLCVNENSAPKLNLAKAPQLDALRKFVEGALERDVYFEVDSKSMGNVYIVARPKGRHEGTAIEDYVIEDYKDRVLKTFKTQAEAITWAKGQGHSPHVARVRHLNDKKIPDHWRSVG
jgi:hypothetical protein